METTTHLGSLSSIVARSKKRIGRGHGSGKVKTGGRGTKGQKARGRIRVGFEGGQLPLIKRLPLLRGKDRNKSRNSVVFPLAVDKLSVVPAGVKVDVAALQKYKLIDPDTVRVKVLGKGKLVSALTVVVPCSRSAQAAIEKAGGKVITGLDAR